MKIISSKFVAKTFATVAMVMVGSSSFAVSSYWTQDLQTDCKATAQSQACTQSPAVTISAWTTGTPTVAAPTSGNTFASSALVYNWGTAGLGIVSGNEDPNIAGPHAIDNGYGIEAMMLNFTGVVGGVNLSSLTIGWNGTDNPKANDNNGTAVGGGFKYNYNDSDLSVLAWTGGGTPTMIGSNLATVTGSGGVLGLLSSGWTLVGNYADVGASNGVGTTTAKQGGTATVTSQIYSSYWLISAYNSAAFGNTNSGAQGTTLSDGTSTTVNGVTTYSGYDSFKMLSIAGNTRPSGDSKVPEPGSIALLGLGLVGIAAARRRKQAAL